MKLFKMLLTPPIAAISVALGLALCAHAELVWDDGTWSEATVTLTPHEDNLVYGREPDSKSGSIGSEGCKYIAVLTDGAISDTKGSDTVVTLGNNYTMTWNFDGLRDIRGFRLFSQWGSHTRSHIHIASITGIGPNGETVTICGEHNYDGGVARDRSYLSDSEGASLGIVSSITVTFGTVQSSYCGYAELEVIGGLPGGKVTVTGSPAAYGTVVPAYGDYYGTAGETTVCTAPASVTEEGRVSTCAGWRLYDADGQLVRSSDDGCGEGESATCCRIPFQEDPLVLEWQWEVVLSVSVTADAAKGTAVASKSSVAIGETVTLTATPKDGYVFHHWTGIPASADIWKPEVTFVATEPVAATAAFGRSVQVSDADGLVAAVGNAEANDIILLEKGTYPLEGTLALGNLLRIEGATQDPADVILDGQQHSPVVSLVGAQTRISGLTVSNGYSTVASAQGGGIFLTAGTVSHCVVTRCTLKGNNSTGGGVYMSGADTVLEDSLVSVCTAGRGSGVSGVYNNGGTVRRTTITGGVPTCSSYYADIYSSIGLEQTGDTALTEDCVISNNVAQYNHSNFACVGGVCLTGGEVRNSLIVGNSTGTEKEGVDKMTVSPGGVYVNGATARLVNCTVADNTTLREGVAVGVLVDAGTVENCHIVGNVCLYGGSSVEADVGGGNKGSWLCNVTKGAESLTSGEGNLECDAVPFADGSYELARGSVCRGIGRLESWQVGATDLAGRPRLREVEGTSVVDAGCYAYAFGDAFIVKIAGTGESVQLDELDCSFTVETEGDATGAVYYWTVDGATVLSGADATAYRLVTDSYGVHTVQVVATNANEQAAESVVLTYTLAPSVLYLDEKSEKPEWPFATPGTAARTFEAAAEVLALRDGMTLKVMPGTYSVVDAALSSQATVEGTGATPGEAVFQASGRHRILRLYKAGSVVRNISFSGGFALGGGESAGGCIHAGPGTLVERCDFTGCKMERPSEGGAIYCNGATIRDCTIHDLSVTGGASQNVAAIAHGLGIYVVGADSLVERCVVRNCSVQGCLTSAQHAQGTAIELRGGTVRNCLITSNSLRRAVTISGMEEDETRAAGVYMTGGELVNCTIAGNTCNGGAAGVYAAGGTVRNCVIWDNANDWTGTPVASNWTTGDSRFTYCLTTPALSDANSIAEEPVFLGAYRLSSRSPGVDAGLDESWMTGATDLRGKTRLVNGRVDMGAYEFQNSGLMLLLR